MIHNESDFPVQSNRQNATPPSALVPSSTTSTTNYNSSFSPTLARLLTAPERITSATHPLLPTYHQQTSTGGGINANTLNISKMVSGHNSEITITPVVSSQQVPTLLQQQLEQQQQQISLKRERIKLENLLNAVSIKLQAQVNAECHSVLNRNWESKNDQHFLLNNCRKMMRQTIVLIDQLSTKEAIHQWELKIIFELHQMHMVQNLMRMKYLRVRDARKMRPNLYVLDALINYTVAENVR